MKIKLVSLALLVVLLTCAFVPVTATVVSDTPMLDLNSNSMIVVEAGQVVKVTNFIAGYYMVSFCNKFQPCAWGWIPASALGR
jgi:hypothetical protein